MQAGDRLEDSLERSRADDRDAPPGRSQRDELVRQVRHQDGDRVAVGRDAEIRRDEWLGESEPAAGDQALAQRDVVRRPDDPVRGRRGPLEDEPLVAALERGQRRAGPAVVRERRLGDAGQPVRRRASCAQRQRVRPSAALSRAPGRRRRRPVRRRGRRRANRGSCGSARRPAARSPTRSPRRGSRRPGCR